MSPPQANHWLFQCANICLLLSYSAKDVLILRILLMGAGVFFVLWGSLVLGMAIDTVCWNAIFTAINALRATEEAWSRRPITFERPEHEQVYRAVFGPVGIGKLTFKLLIEQHGLMRRLRQGTTLLQAGNEATNLTLIYQGTVDIISAPKDGRQPEIIGTIHPMQFIESPQFANMQIQRRQKAAEAAAECLDVPPTPESARSVTTTITIHHVHDEHLAEASEQAAEEEELGMIATSHARDKDIRAASTVEVTFQAATDIIFFTWPMEVLQDFMRKYPKTVAPLNAVIGADVATKLFSQAKHGDGEMISSIQRRIYLPMDEPRTTVVLPIPNESTTTASAPKSKRNDGDTETISPIAAEKLWLERRGAQDTAQDKKLALLLQRRTDLNPYEISALIARGRWRSILQSGTVLFREGEPVTFLAMVLTGSLAVSKGNGKTQRQLHTVQPGQMLGSLEWNEPEREHLAGETITALEPCKFIAWDLDDLRELLKPRPRLRAHLTSLVAADLSIKFRQVQDAVSLADFAVKKRTVGKR